MKRFIGLWLSAMLLLVWPCTYAEETFGPLDRNAWPSSIYCMRVANCEEWVSLREEPSTSADVVDQISLDGILEHCKRISDEFTYCETGDGEKGYILSKYLEGPAFYVRRAGDSLEGTEILDEVEDFSFTNFEDVWQLFSQYLNGKLYFASEVMGTPKLYISYFDEENRFVWGLYSDTGYFGGDDDGIDAFTGGTYEHPLLFVNNAKLGLAALDPNTGEVEWTVDRQDIDLVDDYHAIGSDGTLYIDAFYGGTPTAISMDGEVIWQKDIRDTAGLTDQIVVEGDELLIIYEGPNSDEKGYIVHIDRATGNVNSCQPNPLY